jgi:tetratricopeptide (TPR) repeat protein
MFLPLLSALLLGLAGVPLQAEVLFLKNGGRLVVDRYWEEGERIFYERNGAVFGFPRHLLERVERDPKPLPGAAAPQPEPEAAAPATFENRELRTAIERARAAATQGDLEEASRQYRGALAVDPQNLTALVELAELHLSRGNLVAAQSQLELAKRAAPEDATVRKLLGEVYYRRGRTSLAIREWQRSLELAPDSELLMRLKKALRENNEDINFDEIRGPHFLLRYDGAVNERIGSEIAAALEAEYRELQRELGFAPSESLRVTLYTNREFFDVTRAPSWVSAINDGEIRMPVQGLERLNEKLRQALRHELTHSFVNAKTGGNCPTWLHEGLAQFRNGEVPADLYARLREARDNRSLLPLWSLEGPFLNLSPEEARLAYLSSLAATIYLVERRGQQGLTEILDQLAQMKTMNEALRRVIGLDYQELEIAWEADLDRYRPAPR